MGGAWQDGRGLGREGMDFSRPPRRVGLWSWILSTVPACSTPVGCALGKRPRGGPPRDVGAQTSA